MKFSLSFSSLVMAFFFTTTTTTTTLLLLLLSLSLISNTSSSGMMMVDAYVVVNHHYLHPIHPQHAAPTATAGHLGRRVVSTRSISTPTTTTTTMRRRSIGATTTTTTTTTTRSSSSSSTQLGLIPFSFQNDDSDPRLGRRRTRELVKQCLSSARTKVVKKLRMTNLDEETNDDESKENDEDDVVSDAVVNTNDTESNNNNINNNSVMTFLQPLKSMIITTKVWEFLQYLYTQFLKVRTALLGFVVGIVFCGTAIFVPVYHQVERLSEPITLFETILTDLEDGYVDPVDTTKLFQTGVAAMLRSLDPYTEFEPAQEALALNESIDGKYGGVGLVISGATPRDLAKVVVPTKSATTTTITPTSSTTTPNDKLLPQDAVNDNLKDGDNLSQSPTTVNDQQYQDEDDDDDEDDLTLQDRLEEQKQLARIQKQGIRVVSAFEGYAFDYGMRVGDTLVAIDSKPLTPQTTVEDVRNQLRGIPGTTVEVSFIRQGVDGVQTVSIPRTVVKIRDVKLATLIGDKSDGIGYIQLTGFASDAGREVRNAILALQRQTEDATDGERTLQGLILDLRGNPGGLLTSAVDVTSLLVPKNSDIVSARGRGFPGVLYRSRVDPLLDPATTKLAVLVNGGTASAAEIVSGAIQDLDVGIVVGSDRTFGKGLVQNVEELPFNTALKFTVAKYYTPSGRCIQGINYSEGGGVNAQDGGKYVANKVASKDRAIFYTKSGREVKDGGGVEADYKVAAPKASALEITLLRSGIISDYAAQWSEKNELSNNFEVDEATYKDFQSFVAQKQKDGDIKLEALYSGPLNDLRRALKQSDYKGSAKELESLQASIVREVQRDFDRYRNDIKEDIAQGILARYLPESMLIERSIKTDTQVLAAVKLVRNKDGQFQKLLARGSSNTNHGTDGTSTTASSNGSAGSEGSSLTSASSNSMLGMERDGARIKVAKW